jgi:serine/threonine protein kinase
MLSHPGISRLVSSFRFREGAYLVLEYASRGDLFSLLKTNGSLSEDSTQYVIGEVVASLHSIHELGLVYVDLKPENILITEGCHVKITDFGGCRALTDGAKKILKMEGQNLLKNLRDGDWRDSKGDNMIDDDEWNDTNNEDENNDEDIRIEGTTAYLPPEVILGSYPTFHTDSWALGCVLYQCLAGRPPLLDDSEVSTRQKIVSFAGAENDSSSSLPNNDNFFHLDGKNGEAFSPNAKDLICKLLSPNPNARPDMTAISEHDFFMGKNIFTFYKDSSFRLDAGQVKPQQDAKWTRRQFSSIWAPQPQAYQISHGHGGSNRNKENSTDIIPEGKEKEGYFLAQSTSKRPMMIGIREGKE